jgi:glucose dehydrogenase
MPVALPDPTTRANVIAYLETLGRASAMEASAPATHQALAIQGPTQDELLHAAQDKQNWLYASKDYTGKRFVDLRQVTPKNAAQLRAVCIYRSNSAVPTQTELLVYQGVMYLTIDKSIRQWPTPLVGGITVTSGGVLFTGDLNNDFLAIDASNGKTLYHFNTGGTIGGGVISYEIGGKQYVATTSGVVSGFFGGSGTSAVILFALP